MTQQTKPAARIGLAMMIDDETIDRMIYERIARRSGLVDRIQSFAYADEALSHLEANLDDSPDIIFLDINMPRMNGFEFLEAATERLGARFKGRCVVMLTTSLNPADRVRAESFEMVSDFFSKPLTVEHLHEVANLLATRGS